MHENHEQRAAKPPCVSVLCHCRRPRLLSANASMHQHPSDHRLLAFALQQSEAVIGSMSLLSLTHVAACTVPTADDGQRCDKA